MCEKVYQNTEGKDKKLKFKKEEAREDGGEVGGNRSHIPLQTGEKPSQSTKEQSKQPTVHQHI